MIKVNVKAFMTKDSSNALTPIQTLWYWLCSCKNQPQITQLLSFLEQLIGNIWFFCSFRLTIWFLLQTTNYLLQILNFLTETEPLKVWLLLIRWVCFVNTFLILMLLITHCITCWNCVTHWFDLNELRMAVCFKVELEIKYPSAFSYLPRPKFNFRWFKLQEESWVTSKELIKRLSNSLCFV